MHVTAPHYVLRIIHLRSTEYIQGDYFSQTGGLSICIHTTVLSKFYFSYFLLLFVPCSRYNRESFKWNTRCHLRLGGIEKFIFDRTDFAL